MSFLWGWTKLFSSNTTEQEPENDDSSEDESELPDDVSSDHEHDDNDGNLAMEVANNKPSASHSNSEQAEWSDEEEKEDELLGGGFETLEEEIKFLREQNNKLREKYKYHKSQHKLLKSNFHKTGVVQMKINGQLLNIQQTELNMSLDELSEKVEQRLPKFLQRAKQNSNEGGTQTDDTIFLPSGTSNVNEHGIIDIKTVEWGDLVKYNTINTDDALATFMNHDEKLELEETEGLNGPFIVLREEDIIDAIACFVAQCVMKIPECRNLDHEEMMSMITGTFSELKGKGPLGKMMDWGSFVYSTYGWTATAYTVYTNAALAKTVLSCLVSAAWIIGVL